MIGDTVKHQFLDLKHHFLHNRVFLVAILIPISSVVAGAIAELFSMPQSYAGVLVWSVLGLISYRIIRPGNVSLLRWFLVIEFVIIEWFITFQILGKLLRNWIPGYIAVGICYLLFMMSLYWAMHLLRIKKPMSLQSWALLSLAIGVFFSLMLFLMMRAVLGATRDLGFFSPVVTKLTELTITALQV